MIDIFLYMLVSFVSSVATGLLLWRTRSWTDDDHYALVERYAESTSALTAMKAERDKLQEQLEFSEDVRYTLGVNNAKMAQRIEDLEANEEASADLRLKLIEMMDHEINMRLTFEVELAEARRSLRIARHKEFKRWKKRSKRQYLDGSPPMRHGEKLSREFNFFDWIFNDRIRRFLPYSDRDHAAEEISYGKKRLPEIIAKLRTMDPYPLP
jgi:hypothetical protein